MAESITRRRVLLGGAVGATSALVAGCASTPDDGDGHGMTSDCWSFYDAWPEKVTTKPEAGYNRVARAIFAIADMYWREYQNTDAPTDEWLWKKLDDASWDLGSVGNGPTDTYPAEGTGAYDKYQEMWEKARKHVILWLDLAKNPACHWQVCCPSSPGYSDAISDAEKKAIGDATLPPPPPGP